MDATTLYADLTAQGFALDVDGDTLRICPIAQVSPELLGLLRQHKADLIALLRQRREMRSKIWHVVTPDWDIHAIRAQPVSEAEILADFPQAIRIVPVALRQRQEAA